MPTFDLDALLGNPNAQVLIDFNDGAKTYQVRTYTTADISIDGSNSYESPFEGFGAAWQDKLQKGLAVINSLGSEFGLPTTGVSLKSFAQTANIWTGSSRPEFSLPLTFVQTKEGDDLRTQIEPLLRLVYPSVQSVSTGVSVLDSLGEAMLPPLGYYPVLNTSADEKGLSARGIMDITVGRFVYFTDMVAKDLRLTMSQQVSKDGPLVIHGTLSFTPFRMVSAEDVIGWFQGSI